MSEDKKEYIVKIGNEEEADIVVKFDLTREEASNLYQEAMQMNTRCRVFKAREIEPKVKVYLG